MIRIKSERGDITTNLQKLKKKKYYEQLYANILFRWKTNSWKDTNYWNKIKKQDILTNPKQVKIFNS